MKYLTLFFATIFLLFYGHNLSAQKYTTVSDHYVFQILEEANNISLVNEASHISVFETNETNFQLWSNAASLSVNALPEPRIPIPQEMVNQTVSYIQEVVRTMNIKKN